MSSFIFSSLFALNALLIANPGDEDPTTKKAHKIHQRVLTLDTHADAPIMMKKPGFDVGKTHDTKRDGSQIDFPRMKQGGMDAMFFAVYTSQGPRTAEGHAAAKRDALTQFDLIHQALKKYPDLAELATTPEDAYRIQKAGKRAVFIGMENGYPVGDDLSMLQKYYDLGARYITLTHFANNLIGDSSTDPDGPMYGGLSEFGKKVVVEMNRLGILVDVSHVADSTFYDALALSKAPMIASHSNCRAICDFPRNMTDDMIKALAAKGGVVQVNFVSDYLKKPSDAHRAAKTKIRMAQVGKVSTPEMDARMQAMSDSVAKVYANERASVADIADHIDHIVKLVGIDHVGVGSDLDGGGGVNGLEDVSQIESLTAELVRRNYSEADIAKIWGGNLLRVLGQAKAKME